MKFAVERIVLFTLFLSFLSAVEIADNSGGGSCECPSTCTCTLETVDCSARSLDEIPHEFRNCYLPDIELL